MPDAVADTHSLIRSRATGLVLADLTAGVVEAMTRDHKIQQAGVSIIW